MRIEAPLAPGATIGILGGGQLGRMLALAAARLGLSCHVFAPEAESPAFQVAAHRTCASYRDDTALAGFAAGIDVATYEFENVPAETAAFLAARVPLAPGAEALATTQDRLAEKTFLAEASLPVAPFRAVADRQDLGRALAELGLPAILKTRRFGYDGKGQVRIAGKSEGDRALEAIGNAPAILEGLVPFAFEVSVIAARSWSGEIRIYDIPENRHEHHILRQSRVPAPIAAATAEKARSYARTILDRLGYVGVIGIELFVLRHDGREELVVNELAPRVHNSGHWTMDACAVSQFEQHIRAIAGWPLGDPQRHSDVVMTNLLGAEAREWRKIAAEPAACLHLYGKAEARPGRKMGHVNRLAPRQAGTPVIRPPPS
jgi:5-(carboxyamino)imidazole ribonucleotide synthase